MDCRTAGSFRLLRAEAQDRLEPRGSIFKRVGSNGHPSSLSPLPLQPQVVTGGVHKEVSGDLSSLATRPLLGCPEEWLGATPSFCPSGHNFLWLVRPPEKDCHSAGVIYCVKTIQTESVFTAPRPHQMRQD